MQLITNQDSNPPHPFDAIEQAFRTVRDYPQHGDQPGGVAVTLTDGATHVTVVGFTVPVDTIAIRVTTEDEYAFGHAHGVLHCARETWPGAELQCQAFTSTLFASEYEMPAEPLVFGPGDCPEWLHLEQLDAAAAADSDADEGDDGGQPALSLV